MHGGKTRHVPYKYRALGTKAKGEKKIKSRGDDRREKIEERTHLKKTLEHKEERLKGAGERRTFFSQG
jgi:hypothetical protein